jgi:radical SAM superfamily enzyme YgiQ (UPF0313 family)
MSDDETVEMILGLRDNYNIGGVFLLDDNFFVSTERVRSICGKLLENNSKVSIYNANCRADTLENMEVEFLHLLKKAGFNQLFIGVESGSNAILKRIKKDITTEQVLSVNRKLKIAGIRPFYSFMAGFPFESIGDIRQTLKLMNQLLEENEDAIVYKIQIFTPFPGTELYRHALSSGVQFPASLDEWANFHYDAINYEAFSREQRKFLEDVHFYTCFMDKKLNADRTQYLRIISTFLSEFLRFRIRNGFFTNMLELYPLKIGQKIRDRLIGRC